MNTNSTLIRTIGVLALAGLLLCVTPMTRAWAASVNAGMNEPSLVQPFATAEVARFEYPWAIAFLPDGSMLVSDDFAGAIWRIAYVGTPAQ